MLAYLAIKYHEDNSNKALVDALAGALEKAGVRTTIMARDIEEWGKHAFSAQELMRLTFEHIDAADILVVEFSEKGVGIGIEAGYAYARKKPIIIIAREGSEISSTLTGIATHILFYKQPSDLTSPLKRLKL